MNDYAKAESWETQAILYVILGVLLIHFFPGIFKVAVLGWVSIIYGIFSWISSRVLKVIYNRKLRKNNENG